MAQANVTCLLAESLGCPDVELLGAIGHLPVISAVVANLESQRNRALLATLSSVVDDDLADALGGPEIDGHPLVRAILRVEPQVRLVAIDEQRVIRGYVAVLAADRHWASQGDIGLRKLLVDYAPDGPHDGQNHEYCSADASPAHEEHSPKQTRVALEWIRQGRRHFPQS